MTRKPAITALIFGFVFSFAWAALQPARAQSPAPEAKPASVCGNGVIEAGEQCDDGGLCSGTKTVCKASTDCGRGVACIAVSGDGCDGKCQSENTAVPQTYTAMPLQQRQQAVVVENTATALPLQQKLTPVFAEKTDTAMVLQQRQNIAVIEQKDTAVLATKNNAGTVAYYQCGNLKIDAGESCDDGNRIGGDGCSADCLIEMQAKTELSATATVHPLCGNGKVEEGEACDDGNTVDGDTCPANCLWTVAAKTEYQAVYKTPETQYTYQAATEYTAVYKAPETQYTRVPTDYSVVLNREPYNAIQPSYQAIPGKVYQLACGDGKLDPASEQCDASDPNDPNAKVCGADCKIQDLCKDFDPSKDYDGEPCTKETCDAATGKMIRKAVGQCVSSQPGCDPATCNYKKPECKVSGPSTASQGDKASFTVADAAGLPFLSFDCKEAPAPAVGNEATAVLVSQSDYTKEVYATAAVDQNMTKMQTYTATRTEASYMKMATPTELKGGTYDTTVDGDKIISCTITGPGGTSDPCDTTVRVGSCEFSCGQPNGELNGARSTTVGLDADCKLLKKPAASQCSVSIDGTENASIADNGLVKVPTDASGLHTFEAVCAGDGFKASCRDVIEVKPVCEGIQIKINGADGAGQAAHEGDTLEASVIAKGAKQCTVLVNGQKTAADAGGVASFKVAGQGGITVEAVCQDGPGLKGDSLVAACPGVKIPVSSPSCGNGILETGEVCDDKNNDATDACVNCQKAVCGDGFLHAGAEECDGGKANSDTGDCTLKCKLPACGDGFLQKGIGEQCDDGNLDANDGCSGACAVEKCGDGIQQSNETCDTALSYEGKECIANCTAFTAKAALVAEERPAESTPVPMEAAPEMMKKESTPAVTAIPWVENKKELAKGELVVAAPEPLKTFDRNTVELAPNKVPPAVLDTPPTLPPPPPPVDECLEKYPNKTSPEYQCCDAYGRAQLHAVERREKSNDAMECCLKGVVKPHADGKLTPDEDQACLCQREPSLAFCMPCLGPQQVDDMNACLKGVSGGFPLTLTKDPVTGKVNFEAEGLKASTNLCACPSPQSASSSFTCTSKSDLIAFFMSPVGFSCLYPDQVDYLRKNGAPITDDPVGYRIKMSLPVGTCEKLGGETQPSTDPDEPKEPAEIATEISPRRKTLEDPEIVALDSPKPEINATRKDDQKLETLEPSRGRSVTCSLLRPACLCEGPPPETQPETPPAATTPAAEPSLKIAVCRWNDDHAVMLDTGEEVAIKECPALPIKAFTSSESYGLYQVVSRYYGKPTDAHLAEVRAAILAEFNSTKPAAEAIITTSSLTLPAPEEGAPLTALDLAAVREQFAVKKNIEMRDDGTLKVKDAKALLALTSNGASALTTGPEIVAPARLFKNATADSVAATNVLVVGSDAAVASGGLGGCSLIPLPSPSP